MMDKFTQNDMLPFKVEESFMDNRIILIMEDFTPSLAKTVIAKILYFDSINDKDINIYMTSYGGMVDVLLSIIDAIKAARCKVNIYAVGVNCSAATVLLACATGKRKIYEHASIMVHEVSGGAIGKMTDMGVDYEHAKSLQETVFDLLVKHTKITREWLDKAGSKDMWLSAKQALELGLVDEIITRK